MIEPVTLKHVEVLVAQLAPQEQLQLAARISERLMESLSLPVVVSKKEMERLRKERAREAAAILRACDRAAAAFKRKTDSAETLRRIRDERHQQLWRSA